LEFNPTYLKNPKTLGKYIRKWKMDQEISQMQLVARIEVYEDDESELGGQRYGFLFEVSGKS